MKNIEASSVKWDFEHVSVWSNASNSLTSRLALFLNTVHALKQVSLAEPNSPFFFHMSERLKQEEFNILSSNNSQHLAIEAGFFSSRKKWRGVPTLHRFF